MKKKILFLIFRWIFLLLIRFRIYVYTSTTLQQEVTHFINQKEEEKKPRNIVNIKKSRKKEVLELHKIAFHIVCFIVRTQSISIFHLIGYRKEKEIKKLLDIIVFNNYMREYMWEIMMEMMMTTMRMMKITFLN